MAASEAGLRVRVGAAVGGALLTTWMGTTRPELIAGDAVHAEYFQAGKPAVYVLWHGRLLPCAHAYRQRGLGTLISRNRDGDYIAPMIRRWGYEVVRGSSSRGSAVAIREMGRMLENGGSVALTPDGPRGPRQKMKLGPLRAAMRAGVPVIPGSAGASRGWFVGSWDRFLIPAPFSWCPVAIGRPVWLDPEGGEPEVRRAGEALERALNELTELVDEAAGGRRA